ncbi:MAG: hypothetical protein QF668_02175 [Arenicellales bacterium]|nr:hypothetical protein [Arenicellales bacterium]
MAKTSECARLGTKCRGAVSREGSEGGGVVTLIQIGMGLEC